MLKKNKTIKFVSAFLIISMLLPSVILSNPKKAQAQLQVIDAAVLAAILAGVAKPSWLSQFLLAAGIPQIFLNTATTLKQWAQKLIELALMAAAKALLAQMTQATINWINSGFHGAPLFLENPDSFFKDIAKSEIRRIVDMIGYDTLRFPFGREIALDIISGYKRRLADNAQYTLSRVINDPRLLAQYRNDFSYGGWNGHLINTQYPQNNYLGFQMIVQENLASRLRGVFQAPAEKVRSLLQQGMGFLSPQTCETNKAYNNFRNEFSAPVFKGPDQLPGEDNDVFMEKYNKAAEEWEKTNTCPGGLTTTTPGAVAANQVMIALGSPFRQEELNQALGGSMAAIFDALINKLLDTGLNSLSSLVSSRPSADNWSYNDPLGDPVTLGDGSKPYNTPRALNIPTNVSVRVGQTTSATISGGSGNYGIKTAPNSSIATARIDVSGSSGPKLSITGIAPITPNTAARTTEVVIEDLSNPLITARVRIEVNALGALAVIPTNCTSTINISNACISINISSVFTATIDGGTGPYSIRTYPNEGVAIVSLRENFLIISGVTGGNTFVTIKDSLGKEKRIDIKITSIEDLAIPQNISVAVGQTTSITISGGTGPYLIDNVFGNSATVKISETNPSQLIITGVTGGQETGVIVKDSSTPVKRASTSITTTDNLTFLTVSPQNIFVFLGQTTRATISGGTGPYRINASGPDISRITVAIDGNTLQVVARNETVGTHVVIEDSSEPTRQTFRVNIGVNSP